MITTDDSLRRAQTEMKLKLRLTDRWTELKPHAQQALYYWSPVRFCINPSGRRSGKTELAKRKGPRLLVKRQRHPARILYGAPTFGHARDIFWNDLKALVPRHWMADISETRLEIVTHWGAMLRVFGFDRPQRIEGVIWDKIILDEIADCPPKCFSLNIRPALSTIGREGGADLIGVPDEVGRNQAEYEELWQTGLQWSPNPMFAKDPEVCSFHWPSSDIVDPKEVESARRTMNRETFDQEYGGRFIRSGGKVLPRFSEPHHVKEDYCKYEPRLPLDWTFDFGTREVAQLMCQTYKGHTWIMDEIAMSDSSTDVATDEFLTRAYDRGWNMQRIRVFGDFAGKTASSPLGDTDYEIIEKIFRARGIKNVEWLQLDANPLVKDTVNAVRDRFVTADGLIHVHVHPRCEHLIKDLKTAPWPDGSNNLRDYHWLAALRYYLWALFQGTTTITTAPLELPNLGGAAQSVGPRHF